MLEKDPNKRVSSRDALNHEAFMIHLSKSPLISKPFPESEKLELFKKITGDKGLVQKNLPNLVIPDKIEDLSPLPAPRGQHSFPSS